MSSNSINVVVGTNQVKTLNSSFIKSSKVLNEMSSCSTLYDGLLSLKTIDITSLSFIEFILNCSTKKKISIILNGCSMRLLFRLLKVADYLSMYIILDNICDTLVLKLKSYKTSIREKNKILHHTGIL